MSNVINKHELRIGAQAQIITLVLAKGAKVIHVGYQNSMPCLWEQHDPTVPDGVSREFLVVGTGVTFLARDGHRLDYLGTLMVPASDTFNLMFHVYEVKQY